MNTYFTKQQRKKAKQKHAESLLNEKKYNSIQDTIRVKISTSTGRFAKSITKLNKL